MVAEPTLTPVTWPEPALIVATAGLELLQVPPPARSTSVTDAPVHTVEAPVIVPADADKADDIG